jgi:hypothetical protein
MKIAGHMRGGVEARFWESGFVPPFLIPKEVLKQVLWAGV